MKTKYPSMFGVLAMLLLVASFVVPGSMASPTPAAADPGLCRWDTVTTPGAIPGKNDLFNGISSWTKPTGSELNRMAVGGDGATIIVSATLSDPRDVEHYCTMFEDAIGLNAGIYRRGALHLLTTNTGGIFWSTTPYGQLTKSMVLDWGYVRPNCNVWDVAIAPDDPKFWAVVTSDNITNGPVEVWVTENGGSSWDSTNLVAVSGGGLGSTIGINTLTISMDYGGKRDIAVGMRTGVPGPYRIYVLQSSGFTGWVLQSVNPTLITAPAPDWNADIHAMRFSPTYVGDAALVVVYATENVAPLAANRATYFDIALRDLDANDIASYVYPSSIEVRDPTLAAGSSPDATELVHADLELPSDFSGQSASLRRAYVSTDDPVAVPGAAGRESTGIFRVDDSFVYVLKNTTGLVQRIADMAYYGTYASGKLLFGEVWGYPCTATVPTWFTDSPTTCPIPCWYPALKPTTGAAAQGACAIGAQDGQGNAQVGWRADGQLAYAITGSSVRRALPSAAYPAPSWYSGYLASPIFNDESAFAISRNNGETWNQLGLIDTWIDYFNDVAPAADCTTVYLASANNGIATNDPDACEEFDSVWRSSINADVQAPMPAIPPLGFYWERVYCRVTAPDCNTPAGAPDQTDLPLLRLAPDKTDGEIVFWAAQDTNQIGPLFNHGVAAWSPDFGDYWANINPRNPIQDFAPESSTIVYYLDPDGLVQKMPYTGTAWSSAEPDSNTTLGGGHTIVAQAEGKVLVGCNTELNTVYYPVAYSINAAESWGVIVQQMPTTNKGNIHVAFDPEFDDNGVIYAADDSATGSVFRNTVPAYGRWADLDMMAVTNGAGGRWNAGTNAPQGQFGLVTALKRHPNSTGALYSAHDNDIVTTAATGAVTALDEPIVAVVQAGWVDGGDGLPEVGTLTYNPGGQFAHVMVPANAAPGSLWPISLQQGDTGVTDVTACAVSATSPSDGAGIGFAVVGAVSGAIYGTVAINAGAWVWTDLGYIFPAAGIDLPTSTNYGVNRTLYPLDGMPKPGITWDSLDVYVAPPALGVRFTLEPSSLKLCGCLEVDTDTILWALDDAGYSASSNRGMLWAFTDCVAKKGPTLITEDEMLIGCDPVSGRAQEVNLCWEQLCIADEYDIEVSKNTDFSIKVIDWVGRGPETVANPFLRPVKVTEPCCYIPAGATVASNVMGVAASEIAAWGNLECGHTYYWRVKIRRCATTQEVRSPWSEVRSFTVKAGLPVTTPYYGPQLLSPDNGCVGCPVSPASFSWSPFKGSTKYKFVLAKDAAMTDIIAEGESTTTAFEYDGTLDYSTNYFWQVMAVEPAPSDWSATFSFQTETAPAAPEAAPEPEATPMWVWVIIGIGAILVIVTLVLIFKTRRV